MSPRHNWHPGTGDRGVALYERMLLREMDRVAEGHDPVGVVWDPEFIVDTNFEFYRHAGGATTGPQGIKVYSRPDFRLQPHLETDFLMVVLTVHILFEEFALSGVA